VWGRSAYLTSSQVGEAREIEGGDVRHCSHVEAIIVVLVQKLDYLLATQSLKVAQQFGREFVAVARFDVMLNFIGAGPLERAEWALAGWLVYVPSMPVELLDPSELCPATGMFHLGAHTTVTVVSGILDSSMFSSSQRLSLGHMNMHSNHGKHNRACLVGWEIILRAQLDVKRRSRIRGQRERVVEAQRSRGFISMKRCWPSLTVSEGYFSGQASRRGSGQYWIIDLWIREIFFSVRPKRH